MNNEVYMKILDIIYSSIMLEGGDGDAIWLAKLMTMDEIILLINDFQQINNTNWEIIKREDCIFWGRDQEWAIITVDEDFFNSQPSFIMLKIIY